MPNPPSLNPERGYRGRGGVLHLPANGRQGKPPKWPLPGGVSDDEAQAWVELWATPQAVAWESYGWTRVVARYCRVMIAAEQAGAAATLLSRATELEDRLGLTPKAMRLLLWQIAPDEVGERREQASPAKAARKRIKAVG